MNGFPQLVRIPSERQKQHTLHKEEPTMKKAAMMMTAALLACTVGATGVWAAGPGRNGLRQTAATAACRFVDEDGDKIRKDESFEKNYLFGKYRAIPHLQRFDILRGN